MLKLATKKILTLVSIPVLLLYSFGVPWQRQTLNHTSKPVVLKLAGKENLISKSFSRKKKKYCIQVCYILFPQNVYLFTYSTCDLFRILYPISGRFSISRNIFFTLTLSPSTILNAVMFTWLYLKSSRSNLISLRKITYQEYHDFIIIVF